MNLVMGVGRIENYRAGVRCGSKDGGSHMGRDCGVVDSCSPFYRSYLRAVRWLAEQCDQFYDEQQNYGMDRLIKDIMMGKISPNSDDYVYVGLHAGERSPMGPIWLEEKTARLIREVQRDFDSKNDSRYFGQFRTPCGRSMDQVRSQFYIDCFSESVQPHSHRNMKANTTECVPVPSSEHVAEIVGKKGGKIKNIRAETNTYIKTPKRDEEPVFVITGRKEDVGFAKSKILAAAEHFTQLREARRQNPGGPAPVLGPPRREGDVTVSVEVPYEFVGLVVGQKGATIKRIQQDTGTYITTPSRRHRPIFEVVGQPGDVERAREAIQVHINSRVEKFREGSVSSTTSGDGFRSEPGVPAGMHFFGSMDDSAFCPPTMADPFGSLHDSNMGGTWTGVPPPSLPPPPPPSMHRYAPPAAPPLPSCSSADSPTGVGSSSRLSAFRNLSSDDSMERLSASLLGMTMSGQEPLRSDWRADWGPEHRSVESGWGRREPLPSWMDLRGRTSSLPAADPADPPAVRRRSDEGLTIGSLLFSKGGALGWDSPVEPLPLKPLPPKSSKGSNETLNSDSGIETTTPPPLDPSVFGPIGSKRTSPIILSMFEE